MVGQLEERPAPGNTALWLLWLLIFLGSFVFFEPAPYDLLAAGLFLFLFVGKLRVPPGLGFPMTALTVFVLANLFSLTMGHDLERSLFYFAVTFYLLLTWLLFASWVYVDPDRVLPMIWHAYIVTAVFSSVFGVMGYLGIDPPGRIEFATVWGRAKGVFKDPNVYGPFLVPVAVYLFARLGNRLDRWTIQRGALALFITGGILIGFSRAAWGNFVAAMVVFGLLRLITSADPKETVRKVFLGLAIGGVAAAVLGGVLALTPIGDTFSTRLSLQTYDVETGGRFANMARALDLSFENPFGIGPGHSEFDLIRSTHNTFLRILVENGWLALIAFIAFLVATIWRLSALSLKATPHRISVHVVLASLVGTTANSLVIDSLHWRHFFLLFGMGWGLICLYPMLSRRAMSVSRQHLDGSSTGPTPSGSG
jgi:O-antigen ligase